MSIGLAIDPMADLRFTTTNSIALRIGPSFVGEIHLGKSVDPSLTFERMINSEEKSHIPSFIDKYLGDLGVGLELTGEEMVPSRKFIADMIKASDALDFEIDTWGKACLRMANIVALAVRNVADLPLEPADSFSLLEDLQVRASGLYSKAKRFPQLESIAQKNLGKMSAWAHQEVKG
jgi:hypothetical protein